MGSEMCIRDRPVDIEPRYVTAERLMAGTEAAVPAGKK